MAKENETFGDDFPGGGYVADRDEDGGFWNIRDVPFFSELPAGTRSNENAISREWMESVVERHRQLEEQKHLPAVHANHHGDGRETFRIGFLRPTRVGRLILDGEPRWTLFGDIVRVEDHHYEEIKDLRYPYRSAEIGRGWKPEIASLALSGDEAPHFKLPMLTIGAERRQFDREFLPSQRPALAFSEVGESTYVCFSFKGAAMGKQATDKLTEDGSSTGTETGTETLQEEDKVAAGIAKVIAEFQEGLPALVQSILAGLLPPTVRADEGETAVEPAMLKAKIVELLNAKSAGQTEAQLQAKIENLLKLSTATVPKETDKTSELFGQMRGEIDALKEKDKLRADATKSQDLAETTIKELRDAGWHLSEETVQSIGSVSKDAKSLEHWVKAFKATIPKDPPKTLEESTTVFSAESPEMSKYKTRSPEVLEAARDFSLQYDELKANGGRLETSREEFIDINLETLKA